MEIRYETWRAVGGDPSALFLEAVGAACEKPEVQRICDLGGGANPLLSLDFTKAAGVREYLVTDISEEELAKSPSEYSKVVADLGSPPPGTQEAFDLVFSRYVAEHVEDAGAFHSSVYSMLKPGGRAMHFFPTLYEPAFLLNWLLPERVTGKILQRLQSNREPGGRHAKFPAHYHWCRGPTGSQLRRLRGVGFEIEQYLAVFGHGYLLRVPPADRVARASAEFLCRHRIGLFSSYAMVTLRRPTVAGPPQ